MAEAWKIWYILDPRRTFIATMAYTLVASATIHFTLLSTTTFSWLEFKGEVADVSVELVD